MSADEKLPCSICGASWACTGYGKEFGDTKCVNGHFYEAALPIHPKRIEAEGYANAQIAELKAALERAHKVFGHEMDQRAAEIAQLKAEP